MQSRWILVLAVMASLVPAVVSSRLVFMTVSDLLDPCVQWETGSERSVQTQPCAVGRTMDETKTQTVLRVVYIAGGTLLGIALGILGAFRSRPIPAAIGGVLMFAEWPFYAFSLGPICIFPSVVFFIAAFRALRRT